MIFTTDQIEQGWVAQDADLYEYESEAKATEALHSCYEEKIIGWEEADFGDCWVKFYEEPEVDDDGYTEIDGIKCNVQHPGTHPGGKAWWCTPTEPVMVPVFSDVS